MKIVTQRPILERRPPGGSPRRHRGLRPPRNPCDTCKIRDSVRDIALPEPPKLLLNIGAPIVWDLTKHTEYPRIFWIGEIKSHDRLSEIGAGLNDKRK